MPSAPTRVQTSEVASVSFAIASPEAILRWGPKEVKNGDTIHHKTHQPFEDGLYCPKIFGPLKDWRCGCGNPKRITKRGSVCKDCGVQVTEAKVRRERMGHIKLAAPVAHIWFLHGTPSLIATALGVPAEGIDSVVNCKAHLVVDPGRTSLGMHAVLMPAALQKARETYGTSSFVARTGAEGVREALARLDLESEILRLKIIQETTCAREEAEKVSDRLRLFSAFQKAQIRPEWMVMTVLPVLPPGLRDFQIRYPKPSRQVCVEREKGQRKIRIRPVKLRPRLQIPDVNRLYRDLIKANNWVKQLIAAHADEHELNKAKRKLQIKADQLFDNARSAFPEMRRSGQGDRQQKEVVKELHRRGISAEVEKRSDVDGRFKDWLSTSDSRNAANRYQSLADRLSGKNGRFRGNLLGKRVSFSGRSVIVVGPQLQLHQCGLPKRIALHLFLPFVVKKLLQSAQASPGAGTNLNAAASPTVLGTLKALLKESQPVSAKLLERIVEGDCSAAVKVFGSPVNEDYPAAIHALESILKSGHPILINRAPTLHRHSIQAFEAVLVEGDEIQLHPLVCSAYNADFDGDTVAVHVPLSVEAQIEARTLMMVQLAGFKNRPVSQTTWQAVESWLVAANRLGKSGADGPDPF